MIEGSIYIPLLGCPYPDLDNCNYCTFIECINHPRAFCRGVCLDCPFSECYCHSDYKEDDK